MTSITITDELLADLHILKGVLCYKNMTDVIRAALTNAGYNKKFFTKLEKLRKEKQSIGLMVAANKKVKE